MSNSIVGLVAPLSVFILGGFLVGHRYREPAVHHANELRLVNAELQAAILATERVRKGVTDLRNNVYLKQTEALELYHAAPAMLQQLPPPPQPLLLPPPSPPVPSAYKVRPTK
jgi:hypothetical protein